MYKDEGTVKVPCISENYGKSPNGTQLEVWMSNKDTALLFYGFTSYVKVSSNLLNIRGKYPVGEERIITTSPVEVLTTNHGDKLVIK